MIAFISLLNHLVNHLNTIFKAEVKYFSLDQYMLSNESRPYVSTFAGNPVFRVSNISVRNKNTSRRFEFNYATNFVDE